jgi:hypothetical protein
MRYIKLLKKNKKLLSDSRINDNPNPLGIQYDWIYRLYTVLNLPFEDEEFIKKYGFQDTKNVYYVENKVKLHIIEINKYLFELGILEYVTLDINSIQQIDEYNVRIVLKFKYLDLKFWARFFVILIPILISGGLLYLFI